MILKNREIVSLLIRLAINVNFSYKDWFYIDAATIAYYVELVQLLIDRDANSNMNAPHALDRLKLASQQGHAEVVNVLLNTIATKYVCKAFNYA